MPTAASPIYAANHPAHLEREQKTEQRSAPRFFLDALLAAPARLWHLCSLDAPTVAVVWAWALVYSAGLRMEWKSAVALFLATWLIYAGDRLMDARRRAPGEALKQRHHFHLRHRKIFLPLMALASIALAVLVPFLVSGLFWAAGVPCMGTIFYLFAVHSGRCKRRLGRCFAGFSSKEWAAGALFGLGTAVPLLRLLEAGQSGRRPEAWFSVAPCLLLFMLLCGLNCAAIDAWEAEPELARSTRLSVFGVGLATASIILAWITARPQAAHVFAALAVSAFLLGVLDTLRTKIGRLPLRIAADAMLLTPLFLLCHR